MDDNFGSLDVSLDSSLDPVFFIFSNNNNQ